MLLGVQIEHELTERTLHPSEGAAQNGEAGAGELGGGGEIHHPQRFTEIEMLLGFEVGETGFSVLGQHRVGGFVRPVGYGGVENIGKGFEDFLDRGVEFGGLFLQPFHVVAQRGSFGLQRGRVGASALALADFLGQRVTPRLLFL